jgi:hypothetical protein
MKNKLATPLLNYYESLKQNNMKKRIYRIELTERDTIFTDMVLDAANSNGGNYVPLNEIDATARALCRKYPSAGKYHTVTLTGNVLTIDQESKNIVTITEIEVCELEKPSLSNQEAKDILTGTPTVDSYLGTGIADNSNHENLN